MKILLILSFLFLASCKTPDLKNGNSRLLIDLEMGDKMSNHWLQISGLDWYADQLVLLTQIPSDLNSKLYSISKNDILNHVIDRGHTIKISEIHLDDNFLADRFEGDREYEAIAFDHNLVYMLIEEDGKGIMESWLVMGEMVHNDTLRLEANSLIQIPLPENNINEMACEAIVIGDSSIFVFYEANGQNINTETICYKLDMQLNKVSKINLEAIEYRVTDATRVDKDNKFWVINSLYKGDLESLKPAEDAFIPKTIGSEENEVKRLVQLQLQNDRVAIATNKTIMLNSDNHNWEGLARLDDLGFIIANDTFAPSGKRTRLAFIKND